MLNFKNCTLAQLDKLFGLEQTDDTQTFKTWLDGEAEIYEPEHQFLTMLGDILQGWETIRHRHEDQNAASHPEKALQLCLRGLGHGGDSALMLSPLLTLKRCTVCRKQDMFFFDSRKTGKGDKHQIFFLDYLAGHKMSRPGHLEPELAIPLDPDVTLPQGFGSLDEDYGQATVDRLLEEKSLEAEYLSPKYLREPLKAFIEGNDKGIYWVRAPAHIGKSVFVSGLIRERRLEKKSLLRGLQVVSFHIRREYRYHPPMFKEYLNDKLKEVLDLQSAVRELPQLDLDDPDHSAAFCRWLGEIMAIYRGRRPDDKLLICLDGLDELIRVDDASILDFVPRPGQLPDHVYLLLTSRTRKGCPK